MCWERVDPEPSEEVLDTTQHPPTSIPSLNTTSTPPQHHFCIPSTLVHYLTIPLTPYPHPSTSYQHIPHLRHRHTLHYLRHRNSCTSLYILTQQLPTHEHPHISLPSPAVHSKTPLTRINNFQPPSITPTTTTSTSPAQHTIILSTPGPQTHCRPNTTLPFTGME